MTRNNHIKGIPIRDLISSPLIACCEAQMMVNRETVQFIESLINEDRTPKSLNFSINRSFINDLGKAQNITSQVQTPIMGLVNIPSLIVERIEIEFSMEVSSSSSIKENKARNFDVVRESSSLQKLEMRGKLSCSEKAIRTTDQSSKYFVKIIARNASPPEGLSRLLDIISSSLNS